MLVLLSPAGWLPSCRPVGGQGSRRGVLRHRPRQRLRAAGASSSSKHRGTDTRPLAVRVRVQMSERATLLGIVGLSDLTATGEARARPVEGTDDQGRDSPPEGGAAAARRWIPFPVQGPEPAPPPLCDPREPRRAPAPTPSGVCEDNGNADDHTPRCRGRARRAPACGPRNPCAPPCRISTSPSAMSRCSLIPTTRCVRTTRRPEPTLVPGDGTSS